MLKSHRLPLVTLCCVALVMLFACAPAPSPETDTAGADVDVEVIPAGQEYSGFLSDYDKLQEDPDIEDSYSYLNEEEMKDLRQYYRIIVDPVKIYLATDADPNSIPEEGRGAGARYFHHALVAAVSDAFHVVDEPGPGTLRLRVALVGVHAASDPGAGERPEGVVTLDGGLDISAVFVEAEMVDSVSGEVIAAAVDKAKLGEGAIIGSSRIARVQAEEDAKAALDEWAARLRDFLDAKHELKGEDAERADEAYNPY